MEPSGLSTDASHSHPSLADTATVDPTSDLKRIRELFKYFLAAANSVGFVDSDIDCIDQYDPGTARISSDPILNSLTQLASCRLSCDRAFVSLIDSEHQHVIAEATRDISLYDSKHHAPGMGLCIGSRPLDLTSGVCASTMPAFTSIYPDGPYLSTPNVYADRSRYVINDFALEPMFKDRPYVTGFPYMRWYAEVPIRGPSGLVIGTLAVLDNKPRVGLDEESFFILNEISTTIMKHLEKLKAEHDQVQASKLLRGLRTFVHNALPVDETSSDKMLKSINVMEFDYATDLNQRESKRMKMSLSSSAENLHTMISSDDGGQTIQANASLSTGLNSSPSRKTNVPVKSAAPESFASPEIPNSGSNDPERTDGSASMQPSKSNIIHNTPDSKGTRLRNLATSEDVRTSFSRASHILRQAMDLDGVAFFDATLSGFASRSDIALSAEHFDRRSRSSPKDTSSSESNEDDTSLIEENISQLPATKLASSEDYTSHDRPDVLSIDSHSSQGAIQMSGILGQSIKEKRQSFDGASLSSTLFLPELLHLSLLKNYGNGHIFDFTQSGLSLEKAPGLLNFSERHLSTIISMQRVPKRRDIDFALRECFPGVRSAIFIPLWNSHKDAWFAGGIGWTNQEKRLLGKDDLAYFSVFGNSIMAEVVRLEISARDRAKSNFISSISHELRSPLHGILGSAELLRDGDSISDQQEMIRMIENCGYTMLDTMDHILDFAKINSTASKKQMLSKKRQKSPNEQEYAANKQNTDTLFNLDRTIEETVESLVAGHRYNTSSVKQLLDSSQPQSYAVLAQNEIEKVPDNAVTVLVDIEKQHTWLVQSEISSWRRIVLNLLGNALKYTESGLIEVILQASNANRMASRKSIQTLATLIFRDTGCGIGKEYLTDHLYTPFVQENELSSGTGLGLSIVQKLVHGLGGIVNVQSEVGIGTEVEVKVPLNVISENLRSTPPAPSNGRGATFCALGFRSNPHTEPKGLASNANKALHAIQNIMENCARLWCGLDIIPPPISEIPSADIIAINEESLHLFESEDELGGTYLNIPKGTSLIVVSMRYKSIDKYSCEEMDRLQYVLQPLGPNRMSDCIEKAIRSERRDAARGNKVSNLVAPILRKTSISLAPGSSSTFQTAGSRDMLLKSSLGTSLDSKSLKAAKPNILIVDDNNVNLKLLVAQMRKLGCDYSTATNGKEAYDIFIGTQRRFDCVFMDVSMPVMDGFASTRAIREYERLHNQSSTPVIALTGLGSPTAEQEAFTSGVSLFWTKPVPMKKIKSLVDHGFQNLNEIRM